MAAHCLLVLSVFMYVVYGETPKGAIPFDSITFNQIVDGSRNILVKFDKVSFL